MKKQPFCIDDDGTRTYAGDSIRFSFGIPPTLVTAKIIERNGRLVALTPRHNPTECNLRRLRSCVGAWWKIAKSTP
jgi:hypothetical protein